MKSVKEQKKYLQLITRTLYISFTDIYINTKTQHNAI